jgi:hypothetical protein
MSPFSIHRHPQYGSGARFRDHSTARIASSRAIDAPERLIRRTATGQERRELIRFGSGDRAT